MDPQKGISLAKLRSFIAVADERQFRKAANKLGLSQPALSTQIRELEESCGASFFYRTTREVRLTAEGEAFLRHARSIIDAVGTAVSHLRDQVTLKRGRVIIAATPSVAANILPSSIRVFVSQFPGVHVEVIEDGAGGVVRQVESGTVDFGIGPKPIRRSDLIFTTLVRDRFVGVVAAGHPIADSKRVRLSTLLNYPFITTIEGTSIRATLNQLFWQRRLDFNPIHRLVQTQSVIAMVAAGLGVTLLPALALSTLNLEHVVTVEVSDPDVWREIGVLRQRGGNRSLAAREFVKALAPRE
ncbi:MAG TPA: LysR family transcriptional regulator [Candidatus Binataceae bacterium]|nr:LysR family transcriptional regulator [Candidatus Binataceae bacterium]